MAGNPENIIGAYENLRKQQNTIQNNLRKLTKKRTNNETLHYVEHCTNLERQRAGGTPPAGSKFVGLSA